MSERRIPLLLSLLYPFTLALITAGVLAFVMLFFKLDMTLISTTVLWFYWLCTLSLFLLLRKALKAFDLHLPFLLFVAVLGVLALLSTLVLLS